MSVPILGDEEMIEDLTNYRALAAAVIRAAFVELTHGEKAVRDSAKKFFFDDQADSKRVREIWFAWLGMPETAAREKAREIIAQHEAHSKEVVPCFFMI